MINYNKMENKQSYNLPASSQDRLALVNQIEEQIAKLEVEIRENFEDKRLIMKPQKQIQILRLRLKLILKCGELSLVRLNHLEEIFKHYCTHVFRTGRYMTFERLQYQKLHMAMQRFFIFLKDFDLLCAEVEGRQREIIQKTLVITIFKKASSNSRELSFEEFIQCIQKLASIYWDEKEGYNKKQQMLLISKQKRRKLLEKRKRKKQGKSENSVQKEKNNDHLNSEQNENELNKPAQQKNVNNQNDNLIEQLMNNQNIEDPNEQVRMVAERAKKENAVVNEANQAKRQQEQSLLRLSNDEKIEYYYQKFDIDSLDSYKHKLSTLDLPIFIQNDKNGNKEHGKALSESKLQVAQLQEQQRLQKLKAKMNEKKQKLKDRPLPKPSNEKALLEQQKSRKRKQMKKERQMNIKQTKQVQQKKKQLKQKNVTPKIQYKEGQVNWDMLQRITIDHLKLKQFNPSKFLAQSDDDHYFLEQYGAKPRISSRLQARQRQSLSIVESTKMRAQQIQKKERQKQRGAETARKATKQVTTFSKNKI